MTLFANRRLVTIFCLALAPFFTVAAQQIYQSPPPDLGKILEAPANPVSSISPDRRWILVTVSDPRTVTISDMADSAYYLAGSKIRVNPDYRIETIGIRSGTATSVDGKTERTLSVPAGGRIGSTVWSSDGDRLAYPTIASGSMALDILDPATGRVRRIAAPELAGKIRGLDWSRGGQNLH